MELSDQPREVILSRHFFRTSAEATAGRLNDMGAKHYMGQMAYRVESTGSKWKRWKVVAHETPWTTPPPVWPS